LYGAVPEIGDRLVVEVAGELKAATFQGHVVRAYIA
jgi:hypothetical protein